MIRNLIWLTCVGGCLCTSALADGLDVHNAARLGETERLGQLLDRDPGLAGARTATGETPLHYAAASHQAGALELLIQRGADVRAMDDQGRTPLHVAALSPNRKLVDLLLAAGADPDAADHAGDTPLHRAARLGRGEVIRALLEAGANASATNAKSETILHVLGARTRVHDAKTEARLNVAAALLVAAGADAGIIAGGLPAWQPTGPVGNGLSRDTWTNYADIGPDLLAYETDYPDLCERHDLGLSYQGRHLWAMRITDNVDVEEDEPEFKYIATMHGDEIVGTKMCMNLIDYILTNYATDPEIETLVDEVDLWIVPLMNPDGYDRSPRTRYNAQGLDLNRNFPEGTHGDPDDPTGRGTETQIIMSWSSQHSFVCSANFHGGALVTNYPFDNDGMGSTFSPTPDQDMFVYISEEYSRYNLPMWNGDWFHGITNGAAWYAIDGGMQDWNYRYKGCNEVTIELSNTKQPSSAYIETYWNDNRQSMLSYIQTCLIGVRGIVTDAATGEPLAAAVTVVGRDHDVFTDPDVGDYHRMLMPGTYDLAFEAEGYDTLVVSDVVVESGDATRLDVALGRPAQVLYPNGGETLIADVATTVTWSGNPEARFHVQYSDNYGDSESVTDDFERLGLGPDYTTGGDAVWSVTTADAHAGARSARAGGITHLQETWMTRMVGGGDLQFWYRVSSEGDYDWFNFYVDGTREIHVSGNGLWTQYSTTLPPGEHELKWEYTKDVSASYYADTVYLDDFTFVEDHTEWHDVIALTEAGTTSTAWTPTAAGTDYKVRVRANYGEDQYGLWDESDATFAVEAGPNGDFEPDGDVDLADAAAFARCLGEASPALCTSAFDFNLDGVIDLTDYPPLAAILDNGGPLN